MLVCVATLCAQRARRVRRVQPQQPPATTATPVPTPVRIVRAADFPGRDVGARINAADRALGAMAGEIVVTGGGAITVPVIVSEGHTVRLGAGLYQPVTAEVPFMLKAGASLIGAGWDQTIITESTAPGQFTVLSGYGNAQRNGDPDNDVTIRDVQIRGANSGFNSTPQAISLGNCTNCVVERVWINGTRSIGVQLGASPRYGKWAENSRVTDCLFTHVASQNLAVVNGRNILLARNKFLQPGQPGGPGSTNIDLEPNEASDVLENITIRDNLIDARGADVPTSGNGIVVQSPPDTSRVGGIVVENNTIIGGSNQGVITNIISNGIYVFGAQMRAVIVRNNIITRTGQAGLNLQGRNLTVVNNKLTDVGGGGTAGFIVHGASDSTITGNTFTYTGAGPSDGRLLLMQPLIRTELRNNQGFTVTRQTGN